MRKLVGILGTPVDILNMEEVLARMERFIAERGFHQVATANTDFVINALADPELRSILQAADLVTPDGMPIVWASRLLGAPLPERVTGADIVPRMAERAAHRGWRLYLLGAHPEVARLACARLQADYPGIQIVGCLSPPIVPLDEMEDAPILADIERAEPDILLVAFGNPKQEKWIHRHRERLHRIPICMGVGGTFDFLASRTRRAPVWMQRCGLEWLFRLQNDPGRLWRRYSRDFHRFGVALLKQILVMRRCHASGSFALEAARRLDRTVLTLHGDLNMASLPALIAAVQSALAKQSDVVLDMHDVTSLDGAALGALIDLQRAAALCERRIRLASVAPRIHAILRQGQLFDGLYTADLSLTAALAHDGASPCVPPRFRLVGR